MVDVHAIYVKFIKHKLPFVVEQFKVVIHVLMNWIIERLLYKPSNPIMCRCLSKLWVVCQNNNRHRVCVPGFTIYIMWQIALHKTVHTCQMYIALYNLRLQHVDMGSNYFLSSLFAKSWQFQKRTSKGFRIDDGAFLFFISIEKLWGKKITTIIFYIFFVHFIYNDYNLYKFNVKNEIEVNQLHSLSL